MKGGGREAKGQGGKGAKPPPHTHTHTHTHTRTHTHETESKRGTNCQRSGRLTAICLISVCCFRLAFLYRRGQEQNLVRHTASVRT